MRRRGHRSRLRGFTLVEILVVTVIVAVLASIAVLSIGSRALDDRLEIEARRIEALVALALDEAVLQGADLGLVQTEQGYAFLTLRDGRWVTLAEGSLRPRTLAEPFYLELAVDGRPVAPPDPEDPDEETPAKPQVLLLSSGESTTFSLALRAHDYAPYFLLEGDALGRLRLERRDAS